MNHKSVLRGITGLALTLVLAAAATGEAANESEAMANGVTELAGVLEKNKAADTGQQVRSLVKKWRLSAKPMKGIDDLHHLFAPRKKGGLAEVVFNPQDLPFSSNRLSLSPERMPRP